MLLNQLPVSALQNNDIDVLMEILISEINLVLKTSYDTKIYSDISFLKMSYPFANK